MNETTERQILAHIPLGKISVSASGLRNTADYFKKCGLEDDTDYELEHTILIYPDGMKVLSIGFPDEVTE